MSERRYSLSPLIAAGIVLAAIAAGWGYGQWKKSRIKSSVESLPPVAATRGEALYQANCANCHGNEGRGDGAASRDLKPPPRDFAFRPWRFDVTKESIARVIRDGIPGTPMPEGRHTFSEADIAAIADYTYGLAIARSQPNSTPPGDAWPLAEAGFVIFHDTIAPPLNLVNSAGEKLRLADLRGKLVIIHFWGTGCEPCLKEIPALKKLEAMYAHRGLRVLHVCTDAENVNEAQALLEKVTPGLVAWVDGNGLDVARFDVRVLPTTWFVDPEGRAIGRGQGARDVKAGRDWDSPAVQKAIEKLLPTAKSR